MSVNSKMKTIADKIRAIGGISGAMGLDAMGTNLGTVQTNLNSAFTAVSNKGGTVPSSKVSGNLATAINSIPSGVTVKKVSGTFVTDGNGNATVNCGFCPDMVYIHMNESHDGEIYYTAAAFAEEKRSGQTCLTFWSYKDRLYIEQAYFTRTNSGFTVYMTWQVQATHQMGVATNQTVYYTAVKYT